MKKLLVFTLVVSMLAVAGVAFAADDTNPHAQQIQTDVEGFDELSSEDQATVETAILDTASSTSKTVAEVIAIYNEISSNAAVTAAAATSMLDSAATTAKAATTDSNVPSGSTVANVADLTSTGAVSIDTADAATTAALMEKVAADSTLAAFPAPKLTVDPTQVDDGTVLEVTMFNGNFSADIFASVNKLIFYPDPVNSPDVSSDNMWLLYKNPSDTTFTTLTSSSSSSDIRAVADYATVLQRFIYSSTAFTGVRGAALNDSGDMEFTGAFMTSTASDSSSGGSDTPSGGDEPTTHTLGGSGGGCVAGTSVLALAVLGVFLAKRRC